MAWKGREKVWGQSSGAGRLPSRVAPASCAACRRRAGLAEQMTAEALLETALDYPFNASMYVSSDLEGMFGKRAALAGDGALAELVTRPDGEEVSARARAAAAEAGEGPLRGV